MLGVDDKYQDIPLAELEIRLGTTPAYYYGQFSGINYIYGYYAYDGKGYWLIDPEDMPPHEVDIVSGEVTLVQD